ncbi:hypothetical protein CR513_16984, partial [Mucuna pruriens]
MSDSLLSSTTESVSWWLSGVLGQARISIKEPAVVKESKIKEGIRCNMTSSSSIVSGSLPISDGNLFDNWIVKMLAIFGFQDVIKVVTVGFAEPVSHLPMCKFKDIQQDFQCIHLKGSMRYSGENIW